MERNVIIPGTPPMTMSRSRFRATVMTDWCLKKVMVRLPSSVNKILCVLDTPVKSSENTAGDDDPVPLFSTLLCHTNMRSDPRLMSLSVAILLESLMSKVR